MSGFIYLICAGTSLASGVLLARGALRNRGGLLYWSSLCFFAMAVNNGILYLNYVVLPDVDLALAARLATVTGVVVLNIGLIWYAT